MSKENEMIEEEIKEKKKKSGFSRFFSILVDILIIPIIVIAFACTILTFSAKANNKVPQVFGMSIVTVLSNSMNPNYAQGDVLIIKQIDTKELKVGDNIAFYSAKNGHWSDGGNSAVIFHQIIRLMQIEGKPYFVCMGTSSDFDSYRSDENDFTNVGVGNGNWSRRAIEDGKYEYFIKEGGEYIINLVGYKEPPTLNDVNGTNKVDDQFMQIVSATDVVGICDSGLSPILGGFIKFSSSSVGLICLVIAPSVLLILLTIFNLRKEIKQAKEEEEKEREVMEGNISKLKETSSKEKQAKEEKKEPTKEQKTEDKKEKEQEIKQEDKEVNIDTIISSVSQKTESKDDKDVSAKEQNADKSEEITEKTDLKLDDKKQTKIHKTPPKENVLDNKKSDVVEQKVEDKKDVEQKVEQSVSSKKTAPKKVAPTKVPAKSDSVQDIKAETKAQEDKTEEPKVENPKKAVPKKAISDEKPKTKQTEQKVEKPTSSEEKPKVAPKKVAPTKAPAKSDSAKDVKAELKAEEVKPKTAPKKVAPVKATEQKEEAKGEAPKKVAPKKVAPQKKD